MQITKVQMCKADPLDPTKTISHDNYILVPGTLGEAIHTSEIVHDSPKMGIPIKVDIHRTLYNALHSSRISDAVREDPSFEKRIKKQLEFDLHHYIMDGILLTISPSWYTPGEGPETKEDKRHSSLTRDATIPMLESIIRDTNINRNMAYRNEVRMVYESLDPSGIKEQFSIRQVREFYKRWS